MMVSAILVLLLFQLVGEVVVRMCALPLPGPVVGMVLLFGVLVIRGETPDDLHGASASLLQHLMLLLIPATAGLMLHFRRLGDEWLPIVAAGIAGTAITMTVTALTLRLWETHLERSRR